MSGEEEKVKEENGEKEVIITWMIIIVIYFYYINGLFDVEDLCTVISNNRKWEKTQEAKWS